MFFIKNVLINFNSSPVTSDFNLGMTGEHNAAQLVITPPENLSSDERTSHYRIAFFSANKTYLSEAKTGESFAVALSSAVTKNPSLDIQLIAYDDEGEFIGKSERINDFKFEPSISGTAVEIGEENEDIANEIVKISDSVDTVQSSLAAEIARATEKENLLDSKKVDKVSGKGLSANDFTDSEKQKLASLENYNDSGILARLAYAEDDITSLETGKVDKVSGKGLSTNDFTNSEREKLASLHGRMFFGTCSSAANASTKEVSTDAGFSLTQGVIIVVSFANASGGDNLSPRYLNVNSSGAKRIANTNSPFLDSWQPFDANSIITFVYCGDRWIQMDCYYADSTDFGQVKLSDSLSENKDSSWHIAASAKAAYDLEHKKVDKPSSLIPANYVPKSDGMGGCSWQEEHGGDLSYITHITWDENTPGYSSGYDWNALCEAYESGKNVGVYDDDNNVLAWFNDFSDGLAVTIILDEPAPARAHIVNLSFKSTGIEIINYRPVLTPEDVPEDAEGISYDNAESGLEAATVQGAIDEVADDLGGKLDTPTGGSVGDVLKKTADGVVWSTDAKVTISDAEIVVTPKPTDRRTINDLALGTTVYLDESSTDIPSYVAYNVVEKREDAVVIFRSSVVKNSSTGDPYPNGPTDIYLQGEFMDRFKDTVKALFVEQNIKIQNGSDVSRKAFIPSLREVKNYGGDGHASWVGYFNAGIGAKWWTRSPYMSGVAAILEGGNYDWYYSSWSVPYVRPAIFINKDAVVDSDNRIEEVDTYELIQLDTVRDGDKIYKIKDQDAHAALDEKQDALTAGEGISIVDNVISASSPSIPSGTNNGDILVWDASENKYISKPKWQMIYQPVEYIESDGNQYINTGFIGANGIDIEFQYTDTNYRHYDGAYYAEGNSVFGMASNTLENVFEFVSAYNADAFTLRAGSQASVTIATKDINKHTLKAGSNNSWKVTYDNTEIASINEFATTAYSMFLFASNETGLWGWSKSRIYKAKLYKDNVIVRDLIPVRNVSDGSIGLYETVEGKFYGNNGSGTFLKGADVNA